MDEMKDDFRAQIEDVRRDYLRGTISYEEAKMKDAPIIERMNEKAREIARKYGRKPQVFSFAALMR